VDVDLPVSALEADRRRLNDADHHHGDETHAARTPLIWFKAPSSLLPHNGKIEIAFPEHQPIYETELGIVIGRVAKNVSVENAHDFDFRLHHRPRHQRSRSTEIGKAIRPLQIVRQLIRRSGRSFMPMSMFAICRSNCARTAKCARKRGQVR